MKNHKPAFRTAMMLIEFLILCQCLDKNMPCYIKWHFFIQTWQVFRFQNQAKYIRIGNRLNKYRDEDEISGTVRKSA